MIALLDRAVEVITGELNLSRKDVIRLLDHLNELADFIEKRYYYVIHNEDGAEAWERYGDWINDDPF